MENEANSDKHRSKYRLHESIFHGNFTEFKARLSDEDVSEKDVHGNNIQFCHFRFQNLLLTVSVVRIIQFNTMHYI